MTLPPRAADAVSADPQLEAGIASRAPRLPRCEECGRLFFYPRPRCPRCHGWRITYGPAPGLWTVRSYAWVARPQSTAFYARVPILLMVGSADELHVIAEGYGWQQSSPPRIGDSITLTSMNPGEGAVVPMFVHARKTQG